MSVNGKLRVVLLDSGVDETHPIFKNSTIIHYEYIADNWCLVDSPSRPHHGHGTGIASILARNNPNIEIISFNLFGKELYVQPCLLIDALKYILLNIRCDIVHMSLGIQCYSFELENLCKALYDKNIIMVSAFDNIGCISYPAAFSTVIGVDASFRCIKANDFVYVENSVVNLKAKGGNQRMAWLNHSYIINQGSSFAAAYVTSHIVSVYHEINHFDDILNHFQKISRYVYNDATKTVQEERCFSWTIKKAAIFPYNKETHSLIRFADMLSFDIAHVYDTKYSGNLGLIKSTKSNEKSYMIENIENVSWEDIDTFIIGHISEMEFFSKKNIKSQIIKQCHLNNIKVYCFDGENTSSDEYRISQSPQLYFPSIEIPDGLFNKFGKLYEISSPVVGIVGTSNQQGKFTTQLELRKQFISHEYSVCQLGSEPESLLFNMDWVFPFGYKSNVNLNELECVEYLNYCMHEMDKKNPDIIIVGSQAGTIPAMYYNIENYPLDRMSFLLGTNPDAIILCVNFHDEIDVIKRSIRGVESLCDCTVVALCVFPIGFNSEWDIIRFHKSVIEHERLLEFCSTLEHIFNIPTVISGEPGSDKRLFDECINFFIRVNDNV